MVNLTSAATGEYCRNNFSCVALWSNWLKPIFSSHFRQISARVAAGVEMSMSSIERWSLPQQTVIMVQGYAVLIHQMQHWSSTTHVDPRRVLTTRTQQTRWLAPSFWCQTCWTSKTQMQRLFLTGSASIEMSDCDFDISQCIHFLKYAPFNAWSWSACRVTGYVQVSLKVSLLSQGHTRTFFWFYFHNDLS